MKKLLCSLVFLFSLTSLFAEKIIFSAASMSGQTGNSSSTTTLKGNAYIKTESMEIQADFIELSGEDYRNIKAQGNVSGSNTESHMDFTCDELLFDRETKIATLQGNVSLTDKDNDVKAQAQIIEYNQDTDIAVLQIRINLTQKDNVCSGAYAVYNKNEQLLEISGNAQVKQKEDVFRAQHITLDMDTQDITLGGNVKGTVTDKKEKNTDSDKTNSEETVVSETSSKESTDTSESEKPESETETPKAETAESESTETSESAESTAGETNE